MRDKKFGYTPNPYYPMKIGISSLVANNKVFCRDGKDLTVGILEMPTGAWIIKPKPEFQKEEFFLHITDYLIEAKV